MYPVDVAFSNKIDIEDCKQYYFLEFNKTEIIFCINTN